MAKLTLSVDDEVVERAKRFAAKRETSVSKLVERYLELVTSATPGPTAAPVLSRLRGALAGADPAAHRRHLERKFR
jgi:hypothetical protein